LSKYDLRKHVEIDAKFHLIFRGGDGCSSAKGHIGRRMGKEPGGEAHFCELSAELSINRMRSI
jgi:hypothetical protein